MSWLGGIEVVTGIGALALAVFLVGFFRFVPLPGEAMAEPSAIRLSIIPVVILVIFVFGISLLLTGLGLL